MKLIPLTKGYFAKVDDEDFERLSKFRWSAYVSPKTPTVVYARRTDRSNGIKRTVMMHREIYGHVDSDIDHEDGDSLNNQRYNLRPATESQNNMNARIRKHSTRFKGVTYCSKTKKFRARIQISGKAINIGFFNMPEDAARLYDKFALFHFGQFARTNQQMGAL